MTRATAADREAALQAGQLLGNQVPPSLKRRSVWQRGCSWPSSTPANEGAHGFTTDLELARELAPRLSDRVLGSAEGEGLSPDPYAWLLVTPEREVWLVYLEHDPGETVTLSPNGRRRWPLDPEQAST